MKSCVDCAFASLNALLSISTFPSLTTPLAAHSRPRSRFSPSPCHKRNNNNNNNNNNNISMMTPPPPPPPSSSSSSAATPIVFVSASASSSPSFPPYDVDNDVRTPLKSIAAYTPILPYEVLAERLNIPIDQIVKLDANENPYGPAPSVATALAQSPFLNIYPDPESMFLRIALQEYTGLDKEYLLAGAGADELIDLLFRLLIDPGDVIINTPPTFGMYKFDADVNLAVTVDLKRKEDFTIDIDELERVFAQLVAQNKRPKMIFVTSPNNPDGSVIDDADLLRILKLPTLVVLDEAYFEFSAQNRIHWVTQHNNLIVLRTFSKWAALAGLRVGYGAFPKSIIKHLWKIKQPYNVNVAAQIAAVVSIKEKQDLLDKVQLMIQQRDRFYQVVQKYDWLVKVYPSQSNFVLCRVGKGRTARQVKEDLAKRGILIRYYSSEGLSDCIRVSMGTPQQMDKLYQALDHL